MKIIAVRHGETEENLTGIIQGHLQGRLTPAGTQQSKSLAEKLKNEKFDALISSDLERCVRTLDAIKRFHPDTPVQYTDKLREYHFGVYQGQHKSIREINPKSSDDLDTRVEGGESSRDVADRLIAILNELYGQYRDGTVLLCTHGGPIRIMRWLLEGVDFAERYSVPIENCSIWRFDMTYQLQAVDSL